MWMQMSDLDHETSKSASRSAGSGSWLALSRSPTRREYVL